MTFRARPVDRARAPHDPNRRTFYTNLGFGIAIVAAVLILVVVAVSTWYNDHLAPAGSVNGSTITKDELRERVLIESWRLEQQIARIQTAVAAGRLTNAQAEQRVQALESQARNLATTSLEKLIDARLQEGLAAEAGVTVTPQQVDDRILEEQTAKEERYVWLIAVEPEVDEGETEPTDEQKAEALETAEKALSEIRGGKSFEDVAKIYSTDPTGATGGEIGWIDENSADDDEVVQAIFDLEVNGVTEVLEAADGTYLIARITDLAPATVDNAWFDKLTDAGLSIDGYRAVIEDEVLRTSLEDKIVADATQPGPQRRVSELFLRAPTAELGEGAVKTRHILYSPKDAPSTASQVPPDDPAWTEAELSAKAAYDKLVADPSQFDELAREESDEASAQGEAGSGGKLPFYDKDSPVDEAFAAQIFAEGLQPGQILPPFKSGFGWHVVQIQYYPPNLEQMQKLRDLAAGGTPFADLVRDFSEGPKPTEGGDLGWIAQGQLDARLSRAVFAAPVDGLSEVVEIADDGVYLFRIEEEETRELDEDQLRTIEASAFANWYGEKKDAAVITRDFLGV